jgi:hypothetical protein
MTPPPPPPQPSEYLTDDFWFKAIFGGLLATVAGIIGAWLLTWLSQQWLSSSAIWISAGIGGVIAGVIQGFFIRHSVEPKLLWLTASSSGWLAALGYAQAIGSAWPRIGLGAWLGTTALVGAIIGGAQWLVLRRARQNAVWWVALNASIWLFIGVIALVVVIFWLGVMTRE